MSLRTILATAVAAIVCVAVSPRPDAAGIPIVERLTATAVTITDGHPEPGGRIDILIERWSTAEEFENLRTTFGSSAATHLLDTLQGMRRRAGTVLSPGLQGLGSRARVRRAQTIQFAHEIKTATGRQVVIASDQPLGFSEPDPSPGSWDGAQLASSFAFTLMDIRFGADGVGVGKLASESKVAYNSKTKTFEIQNYDKEPARLSGVRSEKP